ncbi:MAG: hypothetical protein K0S36_2625 [Nitrosospira multiformis]|jgi:hypothetical protein|nr:hypothetical protein [Nitrosospira multiformis]
MKVIPVAKFDNTLISRYFAARSVFLLYLMTVNKIFSFSGASSNLATPNQT